MSEYSSIKLKLKKDIKRFDSQLKNLTEKDFDGHTEFKNLSYKEKLIWLSQAVQFYYKYSNK